MASKEGFWRVPRMWEGGDAYILAGGPGLRAIDVERLRGANVIAVNGSYKIALWAPILFFADCRWPDAHGQLLDQFGGLKVTTCEWYLRNQRRPGFLVVKRNIAPDGIAHDPAVLQWNKSSGACAIGLAVHLGAKRIYLCGFDMRKVPTGESRYPMGRSHWHDDYPSDLRPNKDPFPRMLKAFPVMAEQLERRRVQVLNATPESAITDFPFVDPDTIYPEAPCPAEPSPAPISAATKS